MSLAHNRYVDLDLFRMELYSDQRIVFQLRRIYDLYMILYMIFCVHVHVNAATVSIATLTL